MSDSSTMPVSPVQYAAGPDVDSERSEDKEALRQFIEKFENLPQLWNQKDPLYTNKTARNRGFDELKAIYSKIKPNCSRDNVKRKINTLRCNYRKELKKIINSKRSGNSADSVYKPTSWVFYCLQFLNTCEQPVGYQETNVHKESNADESSLSVISANEVPEGNENVNEMLENPVSASRSSILLQPMPVPNSKKARIMGPVAKQNALIEKALTLLEPVPPVVDNTPYIAKVWGEKLTALDPRQRMFAEKAINDIFFEAGLGNLNRDSVRINEPISYASSYASASNSATSPADANCSLVDYYSNFN